MDPNPAAEELPALYRAVLDRVAQLEASGDRAVARAVRADAIGIYSRKWDAAARRRLEDLLRRSSQGEYRLRPTGRGFRRRTIPA
jgi:hypothetical protein